MPPQSVSVDLLISTYNWPGALEKIFESVARQSMFPSGILIADDGSGYKTQLVIDRFRERMSIPVIHIWHEDKGFRKTRILNKTMKYAQSDYVIQIDGDIILHRHFIRDHLRAARRGTFVQGCRVMLNKEATGEVLKSKRLSFPFYCRNIKNRINATRLPFLSPLIRSNPHCSRNIKGCNMAFWRDDYVSVNGYDNGFSGWGFEDDEFAARLIHSGVHKRRLKFAALCYHLDHDENIRDRKVQNMYMYNETVFKRKMYSNNGLAEV